ncbi:MAG: methionine synthase [Desulfurococcales archaeon ex4484_42]|nr:MAG: methionine synthase [Desulfurococcales archaeon ex4484_42]
MELPILPTTVIGSYPRPKWLREFIKGYKEGKYREDQLREAFDDAVIAVVHDQEDAGIDIPSDGEQRRDEMVEYFAERIEGFIFYGPVRVWGNNYFRKPAVVSKLKYKGPMVVNEYLFLRRISKAKIVKVTITGPYTIADWSFNEYYRSKDELASELAKIINIEIKKLEEVGALYVQIDEPALTSHPDEMDWAIDVINEAVKGVNIKVGLHVCYSNYKVLKPYFDELKVSQLALEFANRGFRDLNILKNLNKELGFGVIDVHNRKIEDPRDVAKAISKVLRYVEPECIYINPDCGLKLLPRSIARRKLEVMVQGAKYVRERLLRKGLTNTVLRRSTECP